MTIHVNCKFVLKKIQTFILNNFVCGYMDLVIVYNFIDLCFFTYQLVITFTISRWFYPEQLLTLLMHFHAIRKNPASFFFHIFYHYVHITCTHRNMDDKFCCWYPNTVQLFEGLNNDSKKVQAKSILTPAYDIGQNVEKTTRTSATNLS